MDLTVPTSAGEEIHFECADTWVSRWICEAILQGKTYPLVRFVEDVQVVVDVGANCGAATVHLARAYPHATVHSLEPASEPRAILERNVSKLPNVLVHPIGLFNRDEQLPLFHGLEDSGTGSIIPREGVNLDVCETVDLRDAATWADTNNIDRIDVLKLDVEGVEVEVLERLVSLLPTMKVLYVEYDSRQARRRIDDLLRDTHELYFGMLQALDQGESLYLRKDLADHPDAIGQLKEYLQP